MQLFGLFSYSFFLTKQIKLWYLFRDRKSVVWCLPPNKYINKIKTDCSYITHVTVGTGMDATIANPPFRVAGR